jgi:Cu+-exporting ATPase
MSSQFKSLVLVLGLTVTACGAAAPKPDVAPTAAAAPAAPAAPAAVAAPAEAPAAATAPVAAAAEEATCPVSGEKFKPAADSPRSEYKGTSYVFCCAGCKKKFDASPEKFVTKTGAAAPAPAAAVAVAGEVACPVSGEKFVPTAESARSEHKGKSYAFCCPGCKKKFDATPDKFLAGATKDGKPCAGDCDDKDCDDKATAPKAEDVKPAAKKSKG